MSIDSLDPRVTRLGIDYDRSDYKALHTMDDLETYQVFVRLKEKRPLLHVGIVHSPNLEIAFMNAKEQYSRRLTCTDLWVVQSENIYCSNYAPVDESIYNMETSGFEDAGSVKGGPVYEVFHQPKRGTQQKHVGSVEAGNLKEAFEKAKAQFGDDPKSVSIWLVDASKFRKSRENDREIWDMLDEKRYRDAVVYKVKHKIDQFKEEHKTTA